MKVLIVDDDNMLLTAMAHFLKGCGMEVLTAENAVEAIQLSENDKPDVIVSDIMMPGISGLSFLSILRRVYFSHIPVIMMSSLDKADVVMSSLGLGADDFLTKPVDFSKLQTRIMALLKP